MATGRPTFPGRTARLGPANRRGRVISSKLQPSTESLEVGENASRAINSFHKMVGSEWDQVRSLALFDATGLGVQLTFFIIGSQNTNDVT